MPDRLRFYLDQHVPTAVAEALRRRGVDVQTTQEVGRCGLSDPEQLRMAQAEGRVLITFDTDFLALASGGSEQAGIAF